MHAFVRFRLPDGSLVELSHGDMIGRLTTAALCIDDPRVSEAHAVVSVRRGELALLSLRRMFGVRGKPVNDATLRAGMAIELAPGLFLEVEEVHRPSAVLALEAPGVGRWILTPTASLHLGPPPLVTPRFEPDAALHLWWNGESWRARARGESFSVDAETTLRVGTLDVSFVLLDAVQGGVTTPNQGALLEAPLRIVAWYDSVEIHREGRQPVTISGIGARILSELVVLGGPTEWHVIAKEIWREPTDPFELRHRWDVTLARLRARLKSAGIRGDLLRSAGTGHIQFIRNPSDVVEDRT